MRLKHLKSAQKSDSLDASIDIKLPFFRVSITIETSCSYYTVRYHELFDYIDPLCNILLTDKIYNEIYYYGLLFQRSSFNAILIVYFLF